MNSTQSGQQGGPVVYLPLADTPTSGVKNKRKPVTRFKRRPSSKSKPKSRVKSTKKTKKVKTTSFPVIPSPRGIGPIGRFRRWVSLRKRPSKEKVFVFVFVGILLAIFIVSILYGQCIIFPDRGVCKVSTTLSATKQAGTGAPVGATAEKPVVTTASVVGMSVGAVALAGVFAFLLRSRISKTYKLRKIAQEGREYTKRLREQDPRDTSRALGPQITRKINAINPKTKTNFKRILIGPPGLGKSQAVVNFANRFEDAIVIEVTRASLGTNDPGEITRKLELYNEYATKMTEQGRPVMMVFEEIQDLIEQPVIIPGLLTAINNAKYNIIATTNKPELFDDIAKVAVTSRLGGITFIKPPTDIDYDYMLKMKVKDVLKDFQMDEFKYEEKVKDQMKDQMKELWGHVGEKGGYRSFLDKLDNYLRLEATDAKEAGKKTLTLKNPNTLTEDF